MKRNLLAITLAMALVIALVFVVAPTTQASAVDHVFTKDGESYSVTEECVIDLAGFDVTIDVTNNPEIVVIDSKNLEDLSGESAGSLKINGDCRINTVNLCGDLRYLKLANEDGTYAFHPFNMTVTRVGIAVTKSAVALEAKFVANDVVREYVAENGEFGVKNMTESIYKPLNENYSFGDKNMVTARYSLMGSLDAGKLNETKEFCAYVKLGDDYYDANSVAKITPTNILGLINNAYAGYDDNTKALAMKLYNDNTHLQKYLPAMGPDVKLNIAAFTNGTVTADKASYKIGDKITLTIAPAGGYFQKLYINGEPLMLDWKTFTYSFTATEEAYEITGSFERGLNLAPSDWGRWDDHNQLHGMLNTYYPNNNDSWWMDIKGNYESLTVRAKNYLPIAETLDNFMVNLRVTMDNGYTYNFRIFTDKGGYTAYNRAGIQNTGDAKADWGGWKNLSKLDAKITTEGVNFKVERTDANVLTLSVDGKVLDTYTMNGITADNKITAIGIKHQGNQGKYVEVPYVVTVPTEKPTVTVNVPAFENGTVTADKASYKVGEAVRLTIAPASGYSQKLYINGEPLMLDWKTNTYAFIATEEVYNITGSFVKNYSGGHKDGSLWDYGNIAHGHIAIYYPNANETGWKTIDGDYQSYTMVLKDYSNGAEPNVVAAGTEGFTFRIEFTINGTAFQFRVIKQNGTYKFQKMTNGWETRELDEAATNAIKGDGVEFRAERVAGNKLEFFINGKSVYTYTMPNVTAAHPVTKFCMWHSNNKGYHIDLPFKAEKSLFYVTGGSWDLSNQHNGSLTILNKTKDGTGVISIGKNYTEASITVKEYTPSKNADGTLKKGNFSAQLSFVFDNGKQYEVRIHNTDADGNYKLQNIGGTNNVTGTAWKWQADLTTAQKAKLLDGDGVKFAVKLVGANAELWVDGKLMKSVELGEEYAGKTAQIKIVINGNNYGGNIEIPFELK